MSLGDRNVLCTRVQATHQLTPLMIRVTVTGAEIALLDGGHFDDRVKLVFPDDDGQVRPPALVNGRLDWPRPFPVNREYTIARINDEAIDIDFVLHDGGHASRWAQRAQPGDEIWLVGPKSDTQILEGTSSFVILGDETALPAIARCLREMSPDAVGRVAIEVADEQERQELDHPQGVSVTWLYRGGVAGASPLLGEYLESIDVPNDGAYLWAAGEAGAMRPIRIWARAHGFDRSNCNISGYWRAGPAR